MRALLVTILISTQVSAELPASRALTIFQGHTPRRSLWLAGMLENMTCAETLETPTADLRARVAEELRVNPIGGRAKRFFRSVHDILHQANDEIHVPLRPLPGEAPLPQEDRELLRQLRVHLDKLDRDVHQEIWFGPRPLTFHVRGRTAVRAYLTAVHETALAFERGHQAWFADTIAELDEALREKSPRAGRGLGDFARFVASSAILAASWGTAQDLASSGHGYQAAAIAAFGLLATPTFVTSIPHLWAHAKHFARVQSLQYQKDLAIFRESLATPALTQSERSRAYIALLDQEELPKSSFAFQSFGVILPYSVNLEHGADHWFTGEDVANTERHKHGYDAHINRRVLVGEWFDIDDEGIPSVTIIIRDTPDSGPSIDAYAPYTSYPTY